jgi:DNA polymerase-3 subunit chi
MSAEISFYHLTSSTIEKALPKLVEKIYDLGNRLVIFFDNENAMKAMDDVLWSYSTKSFLGHATCFDPLAEEQLIYLTTKSENPNKATIMIKIGKAIPDNIDDFKKFIDIFSGSNESDLLSARSRYKEFKNKNYQVSYFKQSPEGSWTKM